MPKYASVVSCSQIEVGDVIQHLTQGPAVQVREHPYSYAYVDNIDYDSHDNVVGFRVLPIVPTERAREMGKNHPLNADSLGDDLGLSPNTQWAVIFSAVSLPLDIFKGETVKRMGKIAGTNEERVIQNSINFIQADEVYYTGGGLRQSNPWGVHAPVGIRGTPNDNELQPVSEKKFRRKRGGPEGKVIDIDLADAVKVFGLDPELAEIFTTPTRKSVKPITSLRDAFTMAEKSPENIEKYVTAGTKDVPSIPLINLKKELTSHIVDALATPVEDAPRRIKPITDLKSAVEFMTNTPEDLVHYDLFRDVPEMRTFMQKIFPLIVEEIVPVENDTQKNADVISDISSVWKKFTAAYLESTKANTVAPAYLKDGKPIWKLVSKVI